MAPKGRKRKAAKPDPPREDEVIEGEPPQAEHLPLAAEPPTTVAAAEDEAGPTKVIFHVLDYEELAPELAADSGTMLDENKGGAESAADLHARPAAHELDRCRYLRVMLKAHPVDMLGCLQPCLLEVARRSVHLSCQALGLPARQRKTVENEPVLQSQYADPDVDTPVPSSPRLTSWCWAVAVALMLGALVTLLTWGHHASLQRVAAEMGGERSDLQARQKQTEAELLTLQSSMKSSALQHTRCSSPAPNLRSRLAGVCLVLACGDNRF